MSWLKKVDHITYACAAGTTERWAWFHIEVEGGRLINRIDDVRPEDTDSSMKIWCIDFGTFGVALVEGIDRARTSQVTKFVERHGDHACQHVAYDCADLDGFGVLKQMFAKGYAEGDAAEATFPEYVERPVVADDGSVNITFSQMAGRGFYDQIEDAVEAGDEEPFFDFSAMPADWKVPEPTPLAT
jgi:4-hydroxyphenylpyruvate dioxygenase-like putative hemolysin